MSIEIEFDDIIQVHVREHGALWTYEEKGSNWVSSESEKQLYRQITRRIEDHLERVTKQAVCRS